MAKKLQNSQNMKAVLFHADGHFGKRYAEGIYEHLVSELKKNLHEFNIPLIHLTIPDHAAWGDETYFYEVENVNHVIYNREKAIVEFLKNDANDTDVYWFCEPDFRMFKEFPPLETDVCMLYRDDPVAMTPAWRLAKKSSLPFFEEALSYFNKDRLEWHGDTASWVKIHELMGKPKVGFHEYNGLTVELRSYGHYASRHKYIYSGQWKGGSKMNIVSEEFKENLKKGWR